MIHLLRALALVAVVLATATAYAASLVFPTIGGEIAHLEIPEPATIALLALGAAALRIRRRRAGRDAVSDRS